MGSGWKGGILSGFDGNIEIDKKVRKAKPLLREEDGHELRSIAQVTDKQITSSNTLIVSGKAFDERLVDSRQLKEKNGEYYIQSTTVVVPHVCDFWLSSTGMLVVDYKENREFCSRVVSQALFGTNNSVYNILFDMQKLEHDFDKQHWIGKFYDREGNVVKGTLFGENIEADPDFGEPYTKSKKNQIGFTTNYFGEKTKAKVTRDGYVVILANINTDVYFRFIEKHLAKYMIKPPQGLRVKS